jgi:diadenosine tetraphosphatase ApaH/serine/threonine PP2A family protein phosphatase
MGRTLIITDIHGNYDALCAVVADAGDAEAIWCLGDIVGYGAEPRACVDWVRDHCAIVLSGNHDYAVFEPGILQDFNPNAAIAARWTFDQLAETDIHYLRSLPSLIERDDAVLAHGSPADPIWTYILSVVDANEAFLAFTGNRCFVGHTHVAACYAQLDEAVYRVPLEYAMPFSLIDGRYIVNPGSVGQPRDRDPRAAYCWYDAASGEVEWRRVAYDIEAAQEKIHAAGLPERLAARLARGQ